jgi:hypothetical protein
MWWDFPPLSNAPWTTAIMSNPERFRGCTKLPKLFVRRNESAPLACALEGRQDIAGEANIDEAHLLIRNSILKFINKCGHMPWLEQPQETWKIVHEFLDSLPR